MKTQVFILIVLLGAQSYVFAQEPNNFNVERFEQALNAEMKEQFPWMSPDTTLAFATRAMSQEEAGYPECYASKRGGMVNTTRNEEEEARVLVTNYKQFLIEVLHFDEAALKRCHFTEFCATATKANGLVRYGIVVDNNFKRETIGPNQD